MDPVTGEVNPDPDSPFRNLSSETPDNQEWTSFDFDGGGPDDPFYYYAKGCLGLCVSTKSQADAEACAAQQATLCVRPPPDGPFIPPGDTSDPDPWQPPGGGGNPGTPGGPGGGVKPPAGDPGGGTPPGPGNPPPGGGKSPVPNTPQTATVTCPDGSTFSKTVAAGTYLANTEALANAKALAKATEMANDAKICLGDMPWQLARCCTWHDSSGTITVTGLHAPYTVTIDKGELPPGLIMKSAVGGTGAVIEGIPETGGTFYFTLKADDGLGNTNTKDYHIHVFGIEQQPGDMPDGLINYPYDYSFSYAGPCVLPVQWAITGLPNGVTYNSTTGAVNGTPIEDGAFQVAATVTDAEGQTCTNLYSLFIVNCATASYNGSNEWNVLCDETMDQWFDIPPAKCVRTLRINSHGAPGLTCAVGPDCTYGWVSINVEVFRPDGIQYVQYFASSAGGPHKTALDEPFIIPAQPEQNASPYRVRIRIGESYTGDLYNCGRNMQITLSGF